MAQMARQKVQDERFWAGRGRTKLKHIFSCFCLVALEHMSTPLRINCYIYLPLDMAIHSIDHERAKNGEEGVLFL